MRAESRPGCPVCGAQGKPAYEKLRDRLFSAPGEWTMVRCPTADCGMLWLDPTPKAEDLGEAYSSYYTHGETGGRRLSRAKQAYLVTTYGAKGATATGSRILDRILSALFALRIRRRMDVDDTVFHLRKGEGPQRLLDIGCGSGGAMMLLSKLGWETIGVEFDSRAADVGRAKGLTIHDGDLADQHFENASFDAVVLSHVIEHLPEPGKTLAECHRLLKPGGVLVMITPNADGLGRRAYGANWRGLEPPRHLQIFTPEAMRAAVAKAGFAEVMVKTSVCGADRMTMASESLRRKGSVDAAAKPGWLTKRCARLFQAFELIVTLFDGRAGDQLLVKAFKSRG